MSANSNRTILLLEDQYLVRSGMAALIQMAEPSAEIHEAGSYEQAIALLDAQPFDIAFLDYDLRSERTGIDVLNHIGERGIATLAVMVSGEDDKDVVRACLDAGACGYIPKASGETTLEEAGGDVFRDAIQTVLAGRLYLPASVLGRGGHSPRPVSKTATSAEVALGLSPRQLEALYYVCQGLPNKSVANKMGIAEGTVRKDYMTAIFRAVGVARRTELIIELARRGIVVPRPNP